jgi:metal-responsive CopG/Arc/MetJ family transcriptional regulator
MRVHVLIPDPVVHEIDAAVPAGGRSAFILEAVQRALEQRRRWDLIQSAVGSISDTGHVWDENPAAWVHEERHGHHGLPWEGDAADVQRVSIGIPGDLLDAIDKHAGAANRSTYIADVLRATLDRQRRYNLMRTARGAISDGGHVWDPDPAAWVSQDRASDPRRVG